MAEMAIGMRLRAISQTTKVNHIARSYLTKLKDPGDRNERMKKKDRRAFRHEVEKRREPLPTVRRSLIVLNLG